MQVTWRGDALSQTDSLKPNPVDQLMCYHAATLSDGQAAELSIAEAMHRIVRDFDGAVTWDGRTLEIKR